MSRTSEVIIGLSAGTFETRAAAFQADGREIACAALANPILRLEHGGLECDMGEAWQTCARAVRRLAEQVPGLAGRTVALVFTGPSGGVWPVDEDGDPVAPACLWLDDRARALVRAWRASGIARAVEELTGSAISPAMPSAQLAWLQRHQPELLERTSKVLDAKAWLYFCCTGERATDAADAVASFGNLAAGGHDARVLDLLGLLEIEPLLPDILDGARHAGTLRAAPAAAAGMLEGMPVVLAPADRLAAALALGLDASAGGLGCSLLEPRAVHMRIEREPAPIEAGEGLCATIARFPTGGFSRAVIAPEGMLCVDWLVGICEELLVDAGLIGFPRTELIELLERKAGLATDGLPSFRLVGEDASTHLADPMARARLDRLSGRVSLYAILRAIYGSIGQAAGTGHGALGGSLRELRVTGDGARSALCRGLLGACVGVPVRALQRSDAAATGAALFAALSLGHYRDAKASFGDWVLPHLGDPEPVDRGLRALYDDRGSARELATGQV